MVINELNNFVWANHYKEYLRLREKGLKKPARIELEKFILNFNEQDKLTRRKFIDFVNRLSRETNDYSLYMPSNLYNDVFKPELNDWINTDPQNPIPYKWSSDFSLFKRAVALDPSDQMLLDMFFTRLINKISLNQHELEFGFKYDGDPQQDLELLNEAELYIDNLEDQEKKERVSQSLMGLKKTALKNAQS